MTDNDDTLAAGDDDIDISLDGLDDEQESEELTVALADADEEGDSTKMRCRPVLLMKRRLSLMKS